MERTHLSTSLLRSATCVLVCMGAISCDSPNAPDTTPASVMLGPSPVSLQAGGSATLLAVVANKRGETVSATVTYATTAPTIATVSGAGVVTSLGPIGTANITAVAGAITSPPVIVTVTYAAAARLMLLTPAVTNAANRVPFSVQPSLQLQDAYGNNALTSGVAVSAAVTTGGGVLDGATTVTTNASGLATYSGLSLRGTVGTRTIAFSSPSLTGSTASVALSAGMQATISILSGNDQSRTAGMTLLQRPSVKVVDPDNNPVAGVTVMFAVASGGGSIAGGSQSTSAAGIATAGDWTLGAQPGTNTLTATASGVQTPVTFSATGRDPPTVCGQETILLLDAPMRDGDLKSSTCVVTSATRLGFPSAPFTGPEPGGTYFYDRYLIDIPANTIARVRVADGSLSFERTLLAFETNGTYVTRSFLDPLVINNSTASVRRYQVLMTTLTAAATGTYGIVFERP